MVTQSQGSGRGDDNQLIGETLWLLNDVKKHLLSYSGHTLRGWGVKGSLNRFTGQRVYLEMIFLPGGYATSREAIFRFLKKLNSYDRLAGEVKPRTAIPLARKNLKPVPRQPPKKKKKA